MSILIPAYFSSDTIAECLESLRRQHFREFEVIVVNSSPEESTQRIVEAQFPAAIFEQVSQRLLPHAARNRAALRARGEILVFTDPDCRADPDWLARLIAAHGAGHQFVCGAIDLGDDTRGWFATGVHLCKYSFRLSGQPGGPVYVAGTANASCTREVWESIGPFEGDRFAGDALFSWRAAGKGWRPWFEPQAIVEHRYTGSLISLCRERFSRGQDFADARVEFERWGRARVAAYCFALPALIGLVLLRGAKDAFRVGWGWRFLATLPLQIIGHAAWSIGEALTHVRKALRRTRAPS